MTLRLTWVQPEDLLGRELAQACQDGRAPEAIAARWHAAGSPGEGPRPRAAPTPGLAVSARTGRRPPGRTGGAARRVDGCGTDGPGADQGPLPGLARPARARPAPARPGPAGSRLARQSGRLSARQTGGETPLEGIRDLARAGGNWPLRTWFTARGVPDDLLRTHPWNRRSAPTSLAENIDGMPEDDDLNYPLLNLLLLQRYGRDFTTADVARLWLDELPPAARSPPNASPTATSSPASNPRTRPTTATPSASGSAP